MANPPTDGYIHSGHRVYSRAANTYAYHNNGHPIAELPHGPPRQTLGRPTASIGQPLQSVFPRPNRQSLVNQPGHSPPLSHDLINRPRQNLIQTYQHGQYPPHHPCSNENNFNNGGDSHRRTSRKPRPNRRSSPEFDNANDDGYRQSTARTQSSPSSTNLSKRCDPGMAYSTGFKHDEDMYSWIKWYCGTCYRDFCIPKEWHKQVHWYELWQLFHRSHCSDGGFVCTECGESVGNRSSDDIRKFFLHILYEHPGYAVQRHRREVQEWIKPGLINKGLRSMGEIWRFLVD